MFKVLRYKLLSLLQLLCTAALYIQTSLQSQKGRDLTVKLTFTTAPWPILYFDNYNIDHLQYLAWLHPYRGSSHFQIQLYHFELAIPRNLKIAFLLIMIHKHWSEVSYSKSKEHSWCWNVLSDFNYRANDKVDTGILSEAHIIASTCSRWDGQVFAVDKDLAVKHHKTELYLHFNGEQMIEAKTPNPKLYISCQNLETLRQW